MILKDYNEAKAIFAISWDWARNILHNYCDVMGTQ